MSALNANAQVLAGLSPVQLPETPPALDTSFADEMLRTLVRVAKSQAKTQQAVELSAERVHQAVADQQEALEVLREQRNQARDTAERLSRFAVEMLTLVHHLYSGAQSGASAELRDTASALRASASPHAERAGLREIPAMGTPPDTQYHYVLGTRAATSDAERGCVVEVVQPGFLLGDAVLRKADVIVAQ